MSTYLSLDIGTTETKVALVAAEDGQTIADAYSEYSIDAPRPGFAEQNPKAWWDAILTGCQSLRSSHPGGMAAIRAIGICGQMHTHVYLDAAGEPIRSAITWMDQRALPIVEELNSDAATSKLIMEETSNNATPTYTAPQAAWVQKYDPDTWKKTKHILVAKDYIKYKLTGQMLIDYSDASGTLLFDVGNRKWSERMFDLFSIPREMMPDAAPSTAVMGKVTAEIATHTGIPEGTPVANGSGDNQAAALGAGMIQKGQVTLIIGTAGVVSACSDIPLPDPRNRVLCWNYCLENRWINLGVMQTAGESLNWFKNAFDAGGEKDTGDIFSAYDRVTAEVPDGCDGLMFLPYLNGERTPMWDSYARGVFFWGEHRHHQGPLCEIHHGRCVIRPAQQHRDSGVAGNESGCHSGRWRRTEKSRLVVRPLPDSPTSYYYRGQPEHRQCRQQHRGSPGNRRLCHCRRCGCKAGTY